MTVTTVAADGSVSVVDDKELEVTRWKMALPSLRSLFEQADTDGLMSSPRVGSMQTDSGSLTVTISAGGKTSTVEVTGLGQQTDDPVYAAVMKFVDRIASRTELGIEQDPVTTPLDQALVIAQPDSAEVTTAEMWPLPTPAKKLFADSACVVVRGKDLQALVSRVGSSENQRWTFRTGDAAVPALSLMVQLAPTTPPKPNCERQNENVPVTSWPGPHTPTSTWQYWIAKTQVDRLDRLGNQSLRPSWYEWSFYTATVGGKTVLDGHGRRVAPRSGEPSVVELRLDAATGKLMAATIDGQQVDLG